MIDEGRIFYDGSKSCGECTVQGGVIIFIILIILIVTETVTE